MDGRRHSVDVPLSRTLVALRRVRSLRDPSTNSLSKLSSLVDSMNWETNSNNAIVLGFENGCRDSNNDNNISRLRSSRSFWEEERPVSDDELYYGSRNCDSRLLSRETIGGTSQKMILTPQRSTTVDVSRARTLNQEIICEDKELSRRHCKDYGDKGLELPCRTPSSACAEGWGSCQEHDEGSTRAEKPGFVGSKRKSWRRKHDRLSRVTDGDNIMNQAGNQCLSSSDSPREDSSHGVSLYGNEDGCAMETGHQGCGIGSCWSRTLKLRQSNVLPDVEERPLLLVDAGQELLTKESPGWKHNTEEVTSYLESPRNLCQKFMPKSFNELVGQNVVARSLLTAISNGRITSLYLFHGPRGTGKTSASRIFAAALNCLSPEINKPCGLCQECVLFFCGRSRDVREVDSVKINKTERLRSLIKYAVIPPAFSRFRVYLIDECHLLRGEAWATILNQLEELPPQVVFIMATPDLDQLPRIAVTKSQRYHFHKVSEVDVAIRLGKICEEEGLEFDQDALNLIATKSNGSVRDAEMMLDQLSLLAKKITVSLVYEVNGAVSDDELLDLLYLALSSDASNTVKRARELMGSRIDPLQLVSQLANLIMDILAGKYPAGVSEVKRKLFGIHTSEAGMKQLSHALKILSETEKQLRMSKNQSTWLTVALLQLSYAGTSHDENDPRLSLRLVHPQGDFHSTPTTGECLKHPVTSACENVESEKIGIPGDTGTLELVWKRASGMCKPRSLKNFLQKRGKLVSVHLTQGVAVAELEFDRPNYVCKAEKSWKMIASALQHILGYNVELRINLAHNASNKYVKFKKLSFSFFSCSRRVHLRSRFPAESGSICSGHSNLAPTIIIPDDKCFETCLSECGSQITHACCCAKEMLKTIRNTDGNALSIGVRTPDGCSQDGMARNREINTGCPNSMALKPENLPETRECWKLHCWRTATFPFQKVWQPEHQPRSEHLVDDALCSCKIS